MLSTIIKTVDTFVNIGTTSSSATLSVTGLGLTVLPISTGNISWLKLTSEVLHEKLMKKFNKWWKGYERAQQTINCFDILHRKYLQKNVIDEKENDALCTFFTIYVRENRYDS